MTSITGLWIIALVLVLGANLGEPKKKNSLNEPNVPFPPARPTAHNLAAVCHQGHGRPRYPDSFFPKSGSSHFRRRGKAINQMESWFTLCCSGRVAGTCSQILCCTQQAWERALSKFCTEEYSVMTLPYYCCEASGDARWNCFNSEPENPNYKPKPGYIAPLMNWERGFTFNSSAC